jgi:iron complex transport system substrate-binding protein
MKLKRMVSVLLSVIILLMISVGCTAKEKTESETSELESNSVTVKNAFAEDVVIKSPPQRIVALPLWGAEMIIDMIGTDRVVAVSPWIDNPVISACAEKAQEIEERVESKDAEKILSLQPDLVMLDTFNDSDGSLTATLKEAGIPVLTLASPVSFEEISDRLDTVSKALFAPEKGQKLIDEMNQRLEAVKQKVSSVSQKTKVMFYEDYYSNDGKSAGMLSAYGEGSSFDAIAQAAGAVNVCTAENYSAVSKETVINEWKPELLVVPGIRYDENFNTIDDGGSSIITSIKNDAILKTLPAVKNNRIVALTEKYRSSTSHYMSYAVEELAKACYPDLFSE